MIRGSTLTKPLAARQFTDRDWSQPQWFVACPMCWPWKEYFKHTELDGTPDQCLHPVSTTTWMRKEDEEGEGAEGVRVTHSGKVERVAAEGNPSDRREGIVIRYLGECGHVVEQVFEQHKGPSYAYWRYVGELDEFERYGDRALGKACRMTFTSEPEEDEEEDEEPGVGARGHSPDSSDELPF